MGDKSRFFVLIFHAWLVAVKCDDRRIQECFQTDSISCVQMEVFRKAKRLMDEPSIDVFDGISLIKTDKRNGNNWEMENLAEAIENATDVMRRQEAIDTYLVRKARNVVVESTIKWNVGKVLKAIAFNLPAELMERLPTFIFDGRVKGNIGWKALSTLLSALKLKMLSAVSFLAIAFLTKKAVSASLASLLVSGLFALKKLYVAKQVHVGPVAVWGPADAVPWPGFETRPEIRAAPTTQRRYVGRNV